MVNKRLINKIKSSKKYIGLTVLLNTLSLLANVLFIFTIANLLDHAFNKNLRIPMIVQSALLVLLVILLRSIFSFLSARTSYLSAAKVKQVLREALYQKMLRLGIFHTDKVSTSEVVQVAVEGIEQLEIFFGAYLPQLIYSLLAPLILFIILSFISFKSAIILLICVPLIPISIVAVQKFAKKLLNKYWGVYTSMGDSFLENIQGLTTLKIYEADARKSDAMDVEAENFRKITMRVLTMQLNSITIMDLIAYGGAAIGVIVSVSEFLKGNIGFAGVFAIIMLSAEFFIPLRLLGSYFHIAMNGMAASDKLFGILDLEEADHGHEIIDSLKITFKDLNFHYEENRRILKNINFEINEGEFVSFVGESGSGKSTIAALIMGINKNYDGHISMGGKEIKHIEEANLMSKVTIVSHNSYIFKGSVKDNLLMGNAKASEDQMHAVLKQVNLYDFLSNEQGLETQILERGSNLSGGQNQRLAIARALLHDTPVYIFDEVTSNIDVESEVLIMDIIKHLAKTKMIILISHRMANVVGCDRIYVLDQGELVQVGNHDELMKQVGPYQTMFTKQSDLEKYTHLKTEISYV